MFLNLRLHFGFNALTSSTWAHNSSTSWCASKCHINEVTKFLLPHWIMSRQVHPTSILIIYWRHYPALICMTQTHETIMTIDASICKCMIYSLRKDIYSWVYATLCALLIRSMMMVVRVPLEERWWVALPLGHWQPLIAFSLANVVSRSRSTSPLVILNPNGPALSSTNKGAHTRRRWIQLYSRPPETAML